MKKLLLIPAFMAMFFAGSVAVPAAFAAQPAPPQEKQNDAAAAQGRQASADAAAHAPATAFPMQRLRKTAVSIWLPLF